MSAYLKFFELERSPFEGKAQAQVVLGTQALREAFASIKEGLDEGDARICVSGGRGLGKTSLARALPKLLSDVAGVAVILDPDLSWESLRGSIAKQWGLESGGLARAVLIEAARDRQLVLVVDQAERASEEFLDHLDVVLSYRSENDEPVVQSILLACLSGHSQQGPAPIVWWLDRIQTLQLEFKPLPRDGIESYIHKHLKRAGWRGERLFTEEAAHTIHGYTGGIPGEVSQLCEHLLAEAAERGLHDIDAAFVHSVCDEVESEEESGFEDEFEELVLGEEFDGADSISTSESPAIELRETVTEPARPPTLSETLEHFERGDEEEEEEEESVVESTDEAVDAAQDEWTDEPQPSLEDFLSAPVSTEELRAIRGSILARHGRAFAVAAIAAVIGGLAFAWLSGDAGSSKSTATSSSRRAEPGRAEAAGRGPVADSKAPPAVLARLRGPVSTTGNTPAAPAPPLETAAAAEPTEQMGLTISAEDLEDEILTDDLVDMRPAAMRPGSPGKSPSEERFW